MPQDTPAVFSIIKKFQNKAKKLLMIFNINVIIILLSIIIFFGGK